MEIDKDVIIRGTQISYYYICHTKLYLFSHFIQLEKNSPLVEIGKFLHDISYPQDKKEYKIEDEISIDIIKTSKGIEIREIKKSNKMEKAHEMQIKYYLYYLKRKNVNISKGVILYPRLRKVKEIFLTEEDEKEISKAIHEIKRIVSSPTPPKPKYKKYCKSCAYYYFCFG